MGDNFNLIVIKAAQIGALPNPCATASDSPPQSIRTRQNFKDADSIYGWSHQPINPSRRKGALFTSLMLSQMARNRPTRP